MEKFLWIMDQTHPLFLLVFTSEHSGVPEEVRGKARGQGRTSHKWVLRSLPQALERVGVRGGEERSGTRRLRGLASGGEAAVGRWYRTDSGKETGIIGMFWQF